MTHTLLEKIPVHSIPAPNGKPVWAPGTIRDLLCNRRYIAEIEINKRNKGVEDLPDTETYRIAKAPHDPLISLDLFEMAQFVRQEKALSSPNRKGRPRSFSINQCGRVFPLQGIMVCGCCGSAMTPWYVHHKPNAKQKRKTESYVFYYTCAEQIRAWKACGHKNIVLARISEAWILERLHELANEEGLIESIIDAARAAAEADLEPQRNAMSRVRASLQENKTQIDKIIGTITSGTIDGA